MHCVTTRFRVETPWQLFQLYRAYRRMRADLRSAQESHGLLRYAFLIESPTVCCTLSVWASQEALERFATAPSHPVRYAKQVCLEIWSTYWQLDAISRYASTWAGQPEWPDLVPHPEQPWRLVEPAVAATAQEAADDDSSEDEKLIGAAVPSAARSWDWRGVARAATSGAQP